MPRERASRLVFPLGLRLLVLEQTMARETPNAKSSDGTISAEMMRQAAMLRAAQKASFADDSVELIREAREQRDAEL
jgi:hypothetical protein